MFSDDRNIESVRRLIADIRDYLSLRIECGKYGLVGKLAVLVSVLALGVLLLAAAIVILFFLSYAVALAVADSVGGLSVACALIAAFYVLVAIVLYALRRRIIVQPITNLLGHLFLDDIKKEEDQP